MPIPDADAGSSGVGMDRKPHLRSDCATACQARSELRQKDEAYSKRSDRVRDPSLLRRLRVSSHLGSKACVA